MDVADGSLVLLYERRNRSLRIYPGSSSFITIAKNVDCNDGSIMNKRLEILQLEKYSSLNSSSPASYHLPP